MSQELAIIRDKKDPQKMRVVFQYFKILHKNCKYCGYENNGFCWKKPRKIKEEDTGKKIFVNSCKRTVYEVENIHKKNGSAEVQPSTR